MKPIRFTQVNSVLRAPADMTAEECGSLSVCTDGIVCWSCWKASWRERLSMLVFGKLWVCVYSGKTQPPITTIIMKDIF